MSQKAYEPKRDRRRKGEYWEKMKKVHPHKSIESPEMLWELACDYFKDACTLESNIIQLVKGGALAGNLIEVPTNRLFTWPGFEVFLRSKEVISTLQNYRNNSQGRYDAYQPVIRDIDHIIFDQGVNGAANGDYDSGIITRLHGLINREEKTVVQEQPLFDLGDTSSDDTE